MTSPAFSAEHAAERALEQILQSQRDRVPALRLDSPPGAGKTGVVERLAAQAIEAMRERCMIATQTNQQAFDLARRLASNYPDLPTHLFVRRDLPLPGDLSGRANLSVIQREVDLPQGPSIVIANAAKWSWVEDTATRYDLQIVDEAFQLPDYRFHQIAGMAGRFVLVGDPGQIAPVITCEVERWRCDAAGPHVPCPQALLVRHPHVQRLALPVSRRLVPDTVQFVQPAFYPELPFSAVARPGERRLDMRLGGISPTDRPLNALGHGASLVFAELPARITGEQDEELAEAVVAMIRRLIERQTIVHDMGAAQPLTPEMIGVVCAHVSQVSAVRERLGADLSGVLVETSERYQGLERRVMFVHHPLSGRVDASEFHLDAGRLCVMLSRHRVACVVVGRQGIEDVLLRNTPEGDRLLGIKYDTEFEGWRAHLTIIKGLREADRVFPITQ